MCCVSLKHFLPVQICVLSVSLNKTFPSCSDLCVECVVKTFPSCSDLCSEGDGAGTRPDPEGGRQDYDVRSAGGEGAKRTEHRSYSR